MSRPETVNRRTMSLAEVVAYRMENSRMKIRFATAAAGAVLLGLAVPTLAADATGPDERRAAVSDVTARTDVAQRTTGIGICKTTTVTVTVTNNTDRARAARIRATGDGDPTVFRVALSPRQTRTVDYLIYSDYDLDLRVRHAGELVHASRTTPPCQSVPRSARESRDGVDRARDVIGGSVRHKDPDRGYDLSIGVRCDDQTRWVSEGEHSDHICRDEDVQEVYVRYGEELWCRDYAGYWNKEADATGWHDWGNLQNMLCVTQED